MSVDLKLKTLKEHSRKRFSLPGPVPGGSRIFVGASDGNVYEVDPLAKARFQPLAGHASFVTGVAVASDLLVSGSYDCKLLWRKLDGGQIVQSVENAHSRWIRKVVAAPDGRLIASVGDDMVCRLWEAPSGKLLHELRGHGEQTPHHFPSMLYLRFSADGHGWQRPTRRADLPVGRIDGTRINSLNAGFTRLIPASESIDWRYRSLASRPTANRCCRWD
jgi:WD40 repeat protein